MNTFSVMKVPVMGSGDRPLMPCPPARARDLKRNGRARPQHVMGVFCIRLTDRSRSDSEIDVIALNIDPGSRMIGMAVTKAQTGRVRVVVGAVQIGHPAVEISRATNQRRMYRRNRRGSHTATSEAS